MINKEFLRYLVLAYSWLALAWYHGKQIQEGELWVAILGVALLGSPILIMGLYSNTVTKIYKAQQYRSGSWLQALAGRRFISTLLWTAFSIISGLSALFWFGALSQTEWVLIAVSVPVFQLIYRLIQRTLGSQYRHYIGVQKSLWNSQWVYALGMTLILTVTSGFSSKNEMPFDRLSDAIEAEQLQPMSSSKSFLVQYGLRYAGYYDVAREMAFSSARRSNSYMPLVLAFLSGLVLFFNVGLSLSAFSIPRREFSRIVVQIDDTDVPNTPAMSQVVLVSALVVFFTLFFFVPGMAATEAWLRDHPEIRSKVDEIETAAIPHFEMIEDEIFLPGTIERIQQLQITLLKKHQENLRKMLPLVEKGYGLMVGNSDRYLNWYYSLPAEYLRLGALITGSIEQRIKSDLNYYLGRGDPFRELNLALGLMLNDNKALKAEYEKSMSLILQENRIEPEVTEFVLDKYLPHEVMISPLNQVDAIDVKARATGAGVGAVSGFIAAKVGTKMAAKGTIKLAGKAIVKAAATKAGAASAGAAVGALIGSVIPVAGTLLGTGIGAGVGIVIGVSVDALLLKVEEVLTREQFARQLAEAINESKAEMVKNLGLVAAPQK